MANTSYPKLLIKMGIANTADNAGNNPPAIFQAAFLFVTAICLSLKKILGSSKEKLI